jgi:hypothetical protein
MKFASFEINNERILASLAESNDVQLLNIYKKMTNLQWKSKTGKWKTSTPFKLGETVKVAGRKNTVKLDFQNDIM